MGIGHSEQIERKLDKLLNSNPDKPWQPWGKSYKWVKKMKHKKERQRARQDVECFPYYNRYSGWVW